MAIIKIDGDLHIPGDTIKVVGSRALSIQASNDVFIDEGAVFDLSASGTEPGPGGGTPGRDGVSVRFSRLPCSSKVEVAHLLRLLEAGADGVEVITCREGKCQFLGGNERAWKRVERTRRLLDEAGIGGGRVGVSRAERLADGGLRRIVRARAEEARSLGSNPMKEGREG